MRTRRRLFRVWHRRIGLLSSFFLLWIAVTGLLLNHNASLGLEGPTRMGTLAQWMGVSVYCENAAWPVSSGVLVACENGLYLGDERIAELATVRAATEAGPWIVVLSDEGLWVLDQQGRLVDVLTLPAGTDGLRRASSSVVLTAGSQVWELDTELLELRPRGVAELDALSPPVPVAVDAVTAAGFARRASGEALSWSRLLQELHSGRILARVGPRLLDLTAVALIVLALLGIIIDVRRSHPGQGKH